MGSINFIALVPKLAKVWDFYFIGNVKKINDLSKYVNIFVQKRFSCTRHEMLLLTEKKYV